MGNAKHGEIVQSSKSLICIDFGEYCVYLFFLDCLIEIITEIVHNNI